MIGSGNTIILDDATMTASSTVLNSASGPFAAGDVGKKVGVLGAGSAGATLISTISSFTNSSQVTLANSASTTVSNAHFAFGTDDTSALTSFFSANVGKAASLDPGAKYICTAALTSQLKLLEAQESAIVFLIPNNTSNCFTIVPPKPLAADQITSRAVYKDLYLDGMATGLDLLFERDGSMRLDGLTLDNAWRDAFMLNPRAADDEAIENLTGFDWVVRNAGRHGMHVNLSGGGLTNKVVYCNETNIFAFEIRSLGRRFTGANAIRFTYDDVVETSGSKISHFFVIGANWDADQAHTSGGNSIGDIIFHDAINGTTIRRVENFRLEPGGLESTSGTVSGKMVLNGSNFTAGDWIETHVEQGQPFNWGSGVPNAFLSDPEWGNEYMPNSPVGKFYRRFFKLPVDGRSIVSGDAAPNGGYIDPNFKNSPTVFSTSGNLVASANVTIDVPIHNANGGMFDYAEWPLRLLLSHHPFFTDATKWTYAEYAVMIAYTASDGVVRVGDKLIFNGIGADPTVSFNPANVTFSIPNSTTLRVTIPGGANVGAAGAQIACHLTASRWGMLIGEAQRTSVTGLQLNMTL